MDLYRLSLEELRERVKELEIILDNLSDGIYITDGNGITLRVNRAFLEMARMEGKELVGRNIAELVAEGYFSESASIMVMKTKAPSTVLYKTSTGRRLLARGIPVFDEQGNIYRIVNSVADITKLHALRDEVEQSRNLVFEIDKEVAMLENDFICHSPLMRNTIDLAIRVSKVDSTVLIEGESGVGKEVIARFIHNAGTRSNGPFVRVNCAAIPENLIESELFGYEKGAFTGASKEGKKGLFEVANGGSLFLDEIGELPLALQAKLLRVLQEHELMRIGGVKAISVDARVIVATNRPLSELVAKGLFREDLFYRLNVVPLTIPTLRERNEDIEPLSTYFLNKFGKKYGKEKWITDKALELLKIYSWPGNVRELENLMERVVVLKNSSNIDESDIRELLLMSVRDKSALAQIDIPLKERVAIYEAKIIKETLTTYKTTRKAAKVLGIDQSTLVRKIQRYRLSNEVTEDNTDEI